AHSVVIEDRTTGYPRHHRLDLDFVTTSEFRALANSYQEVTGLRARIITRPQSAAATSGEEETGAAANETAIGGAPLDDATKLAAEAKDMDASSMPRTTAKPKDADVRLESL